MTQILPLSHALEAVPLHKKLHFLNALGKANFAFLGVPRGRNCVPEVQPSILEK